MRVADDCTIVPELISCDVIGLDAYVGLFNRCSKVHDTGSPHQGLCNLAPAFRVCWWNAAQRLETNKLIEP